MSAPTTQQGLPGSRDDERARYVREHGHLTTRQPAGKTITATATGEAFCRDCGNRVTVGRRNGALVEFGHVQSGGWGRCPHRPDGVDADGGDST